MGTIKPIKVGEVPVEGDPVEFLIKEDLNPNDCVVLIVCGEKREHHKLTIGKHVNICDHTPKQILEDYELKELHLNAASECVRVQIWKEQWDIEFVP